MAKRFTDSNKWEDDWFASLPPKYKLFWLYLCDRCDHAGIWKISAHVAKALIGEEVDLAEAAELFKDRIEAHEGFWWVKKFCHFQYGRLNQSNKTHASVMKILDSHKLPLDSHGISENPKESQSSHKGAKDKDKDIIKSNGKQKLELEVINKKKENQSDLFGFSEFWSSYPRHEGRKKALKVWLALTDQDRAAAIEAIPKHKQRQDWLKDEGQFIPHASTWLNGHRWEDELGKLVPNVEDIHKARETKCKAVGHPWKPKIIDGMDSENILICARCGKERGL